MCKHSCADTHIHALVHTHTHTHVHTHILMYTQSDIHQHSSTHIHAHMLIYTLLDVHTSIYIYILISYMHVLLHYSLMYLIVMPQNRNEKGRDQNTERSAAIFFVSRWWIACPHLGAHCFPALATQFCAGSSRGLWGFPSTYRGLRLFSFVNLRSVEDSYVLNPPMLSNFTDGNTLVINSV